MSDGSRRAHIPPEVDWNFPSKIVKNQDVLYYKNKARRDFFEEKGASKQFC